MSSKNGTLRSALRCITGSVICKCGLFADNIPYMLILSEEKF